MRYILALSLLAISLSLFFLSKFKLKEFIKIYVFFFFLVFPFIGGYIPPFEILTINLTAERIFFFGFAFLLIFLFLKSGFKLKVSKVAFWLFAYDTYLILNRIIQSKFVQAEFLNFILPVGFLILIENLEFTENDLKIFKKILIIVAVGTFIASFIQITVNPYFYQGSQEWTEEFLERYRVTQSLYRNASIYVGLGRNEGGIAMGYLAMFFMFLNFKKYSVKYIIVTGMMLFCSLITFTRYVWLMPIIGLMYFLHYKYRKNKFLIFTTVGLIFIIGYVLFFASIEKTTVYQERAIADTYWGRIESSSIFFKFFFSQKPIFGYGISSWGYDKFRVMYPIGIHVGLFDIIFRGGLIAFSLYFIFLYQIYKRGLTIFKKTGNPIFLAFIAVFLVINMTAGFINIDYYGYYIMLFYLTMSYKLYVRNMKPVRVETIDYEPVVA